MWRIRLQWWIVGRNGLLESHWTSLDLIGSHWNTVNKYHNWRESQVVIHEHICDCQDSNDSNDSDHRDQGAWLEIKKITF